MDECFIEDTNKSQTQVAGRVCPADYGLHEGLFSGTPELSCDALFVVGGLYGNVFALDALDDLVANEPGSVLTVLNGDIHWFDKTAEHFALVENRIRPYLALLGNVEAELRRPGDIGVGCGCAYPPHVSDEVVARSNSIHALLKSALCAHPELTALLAARPPTAIVDVCGEKVAITHGDEKLLGGWGCAREALRQRSRQKELASWFERTGSTVLATTHTCAPAAIRLSTGVIANNGSAGMPNFSGQDFGLVLRIAANPSPEQVFFCYHAGLFIEAVPLRFDADAFLAWFDDLWPTQSPAAISYRRRIAQGVADKPCESILGGFSLPFTPPTKLSFES